jgi:hypothetical protein
MRRRHLEIEVPCPAIHDDDATLPRLDAVIVESFSEDLKPLRVHRHRVHGVRRLLPPHRGEQPNVELRGEIEDLPSEDAASVTVCVRGLHELAPLDLVVLGPHVRIARREGLHLPREVRALELKKRPVQFSPSGGVDRDSAEAEERRAAL